MRHRHRAHGCGGIGSYEGSCGTCPRCQPTWYRDGVLIEGDEPEDAPDDFPDDLDPPDDDSA